jgi:hypothetical protein
LHRWSVAQHGLEHHPTMNANSLESRVIRPATATRWPCSAIG